MTTEKNEDDFLKLQPASYEIYQKKYMLVDKNSTPVDKSILDTFSRIAKTLSDVESEEKRDKWYKEFLWCLVEGGCLPGGRIISNAGAGEYKPATSLINCVVSNLIRDSMSDILLAVHEAGMTLKAGCGIGYDFSTLRPKNAYVAGAGANTSGPLSFMDIFDRMCFTVSSAGGRRGAEMGTLDVQHPDVFDFIKAKRENGRLRQFNLSLLITDAFIDAVRNDLDWKLVFPIKLRDISDNNIDLTDVNKIYFREWPIHEDYFVNEDGLVACKIYKTVKARVLWNAIMSATYDYAEPGFLLIDRINRLNNLWWVENIRATNPCVVGNTLILTREGLKTIESVAGKTLDIWNGFEWSEVTPRITGENQEVYDVELSDGSELTVTGNHKFILADNSRISTLELKSGTELAEWDLPVIEGNVHLEDKVAYTQGFYSGDGSNNRNEIWLYEEKINLLHHLDIKSQTDQSNHRQLRYSCVVNFDVMPKNWVPDSSYTVRTRLNWLAGLIDSDGACFSGSVEVWSVDHKFLSDVRNLLLELGIRCRLVIGKKAETKLMPDGKGGKKLYNCKASYRILLNKLNINKLIFLGLRTHRVVIGYTAFLKPKVNPVVRVVSVVKKPYLEPRVYCFTDRKNNSGVFNGVMTANCGEQPLPPYSACLLGSINLAKFVKNPFTEQAEFDWYKFNKTVKIFSRMLDNVVDINNLPLKQQSDEILRKRRHGMGYSGLGSALTLMRIKYGSKEAVEFTDKVTSRLALVGWEAALELSIEKGPAPIMSEKFIITKEMMNKCKELKEDGYEIGDEVTGALLHSYSGYMKEIKKINPHLVENLRTYGARYSHATTIAPVGTTSFSLGNNISNGVEPSFAHQYSRNVIVEGKKSKEKVNVYSYELLLYKELINPDADPFATEGVNMLPDYFSNTDSITAEEHVDMQGAAQKWIDSSISKTLNIPTDYPFEKFKDIYMYGYEKGLKGLATFRFNPEIFQGVLIKESDLENTKYQFTLEDGTVIEVAGNEEIEYDGESHGAANLFDALKEGYYGKF